MADAAAVLTSSPMPASPAPAAAPASAAPPPAAATEGVVTPAAAKGPLPEHKSRARDLAGKFLQGGAAAELATPPAPAETPANETEAAPEAEKPAEPASKKKPTKAEAKAAEEEAAKKAAEEQAEKDKEEAARIDREWKEIRRRKKQARNLKQEREAFEQNREAWIREQRADAELKERDPAAWLEKHQFDFRDVAKKAVEKEAETPETRAAKEREAENKRLREEIDQIKRDAATRAQREALSELRSEINVGWSEAKATNPTLAAHYSETEIADAAMHLRIEHFKATRRADAARRGVPEDQGRGIEAPLADVFAHMERNARAERERFTRSQAAERTERETVDAAPAAAKTRAKVGPPVTNQVSATRASPQTRLTDAEKRERASARAAEFLGGRSR